MRYPSFRAQGLFLGSGLIEAGCKTVIGVRLKCSRMFWTVRGANAIIALRCCRLSRRFEDYWADRSSAAGWSTFLSRTPAEFDRERVTQIVQPSVYLRPGADDALDVVLGFLSRDAGQGSLKLRPAVFLGGLSNRLTRSLRGYLDASARVAEIEPPGPASSSLAHLRVALQSLRGAVW